MTIGENIQNVRKSKHMTRTALAKQISIAVPLLKKIENDIVLPSKSLINKISIVLQVEPSTFRLDEKLKQMSQGERLQYYRKNIGMSQTEFSKKLGFGISYISVLEQGIRNITLNTLYRAADILNVSFTDLCPNLDYNSMSDGEKIKFYREIQNISRKEVGKKTNIPLQRLKKIENNSVKPSIIEMIHIVESLNLNYSTFDIFQYTIDVRKGDVVQYYRKVSKMTTMELAKELGISCQHLSDIETNKRKPNKKILRKIAKICNFDISVFAFDNMSRGEKIKYYREKSGLSQEELASQIANLHQSELALIEDNRKRISDQMYFQISKILHFTDAYFESKSTGDIIKHHRLKAGLTQRELCSKAGVSCNVLTRIENNKQNCSNKSLLKIVCALDLAPYSFNELKVQDVEHLSRGQIIKSYRKTAGISLDDLANRVGKSRTYIRSIENEEITPSDSTLINIAEVLGIDATILS